MRRAGISTLSLLLVLTLSSTAFAAKSKNSADGEIIAMDGRTMVLKVKKNEESFKLNRDTEYRRANEELRAGHFKVGDRVRVKYRVEEEDKIAVRVEMWIPPHKLRRGGV